MAPAWLLLLLFHLNYSHFYVGSMYDAPPCSTVVHIISRQSLNSLWCHPLLCPTIFSWVFLSSFSPVLSFYDYHASPYYLRSVPIFSSHVHTTSTFFHVLSLWFPPLLLSLLFFHFWSCPASLLRTALAPSSVWTGGARTNSSDVEAPIQLEMKLWDARKYTSSHYRSWHCNVQHSANPVITIIAVGLHFKGWHYNVQSSHSHGKAWKKSGHGKSWKMGEKNKVMEIQKVMEKSWNFSTAYRKSRMRNSDNSISIYI